MFNFSEKCQKIKTKLLVLSGISLFIGLTEALPQKVAVLGLDLSMNSSITGWFIVAVAFYFFLKFITLSILEIIDHFRPSIIKFKTNTTTGDMIGLTATECNEVLQNENDFENADLGTPFGEIKDIDRKNKMIENKYKRNYVSIHNFVVYVMDFIFPILLWFVSFWYLYLYLNFV